MTAILSTCAAAGCAATSNFFLRKNTLVPAVVNSNGYLVNFYLFSLLAACIAYPQVFWTAIDWQTLGTGAVVGTLNVLLMLVTSAALMRGPSGMTFAFQTCSAVFPGMLLFLIFGPSHGFEFYWQQLIGIILVVVGLFWGARTTSGSSFTEGFLGWFKYALASFTIQVLALTLIQGRSVLFESQGVDAWFMPGQFGAALILQSLLFLREKRKPTTSEIFYGSMGGITNAVSTFLLLFATQAALPNEQGILFPVFAVSTLTLCNLWAYKIFGEDFPVIANLVCAVGVLVAFAH